MSVARGEVGVQWLRSVYGIERMCELERGGMGGGGGVCPSSSLSGMEERDVKLS